MIVYVLVATAVYDQGVVGVYTGPDAEHRARAAAEEIWIKTDGHHDFRIDRIEGNKTYEDVFPHWSPFTGRENGPASWQKHAEPPARIELEDRVASVD